VNQLEVDTWPFNYFFFKKKKEKKNLGWVGHPLGPMGVALGATRLPYLGKKKTLDEVI
jgi:hypothetical protein